MGVQRKGDIASRRAFPRDERANGGQNRLRLGRPERARHEVVLHIHDDEQPFYRHFFRLLDEKIGDVAAAAVRGMHAVRRKLRGIDVLRDTHKDLVHGNERDVP